MERGHRVSASGTLPFEVTSSISSAERLIYEILSGIREGQLTLRSPSGEERQFGKPGTEPAATLVVHDARFFSRVLQDATLGFGESYMDGEWDAENGRLADVLGVLLRNDLHTYVRGNMRLIARCAFQRFRSRPTSRRRSQSNVMEHYDLGNDFYESFLGPTMTYSCGYQRTPSDTLEDMQRQKYDRICQKLSLSKDDTLIDIGCGWGGMLIYAAKTYGISGTGITLSKEQQTWAVRKIAEEGLSEKITIALQDYRDVRGQFDKFVSIGMFEHVGKKNYGTFMRKAQTLLRPGGLGLLHTIGSTFPSHLPANEWVNRYIFPGGRIPRLQEMVQCMNQHDLTIGHVENLKMHYAETLHRWQEQFRANEGKVRALGSHFDNRFIRMWNFYLHGCEASFQHDRLQLYQILFCNGKTWTLPRRFDYA